MTDLYLVSSGFELAAPPLKRWQIGEAISSNIILSHFPSKLTDPGGLSLLIDNNHFFHFFHTHFTEFKLQLAISVVFVRNERTDSMNDRAEFAFLANMLFKVPQSI
jgi:hypothetical protein